MLDDHALTRKFRLQSFSIPKAKILNTKVKF